ncbi:hypothetical protein C1646_666583 [Rhizophagus diaphanus]|nr:hypothetical protein C1646_666583 [Rhizophagus diaphanus] [Rhizophagus sp. MUCL 43196]
MKIAFFALDKIFKGNEITCKKLCELYAKFSKMYIMSRKEMYIEEDLKIFEEAIIDWCIDFKKIFSLLSTTDCNFLKLHSWQYHAGKNKELTSSAKKVIHHKAKEFGKVL